MAGRADLRRGHDRCQALKALSLYEHDVPVLMRCLNEVRKTPGHDGFCYVHARRRPEIHNATRAYRQLLLSDWEARSVAQAFACGHPLAEAMFSALVLSSEREGTPIWPLDPAWRPFSWEYQAKAGKVPQLPEKLERWYPGVAPDVREILEWLKLPPDARPGLDPHPGITGARSVQAVPAPEPKPKLRVRQAQSSMESKPVPKTRAARRASPPVAAPPDPTPTPPPEPPKPATVEDARARLMGRWGKR